MIFSDLVASTLQKKVYLLFHLMTERSDMGFCSCAGGHMVFPVCV